MEMKSTCLNCGFEIDREMKGCPNCGTKIETKSSRRFSKVLAIFIVFMLLLVSVYVYFIVLRVEDYYQPKGIEIDGDFSDWDDVPTMPDEIEGSLFNQDVDMVDYRVEGLYEELSFYLRVERSLLDGQQYGERHVDTVYIFIDSDQDPQTGFIVESIGCEYMIVIYGSDAQILDSVLYRYSSSDQDWNKWEEIKGISCAISGTELEAQVGYKDVGLGKNGAVDVIFYIQSWDGFEDLSDTVISNAEGVLMVDQTGIGSDVIEGNENRLLELELLARNADITVSEIVVTRIGIASSNDINTIYLEDEHGSEIHTGTMIDNRVTIQPNLQLVQDQEYIFYIMADISGNAQPENSIGLTIANRMDITSDAGTVSLNWNKGGDGDNEVSYINYIPENVSIDSAFPDWNDKQVRNDVIGEVMRDDIDIKKYGVSCSEQEVNFYLQVNGRIGNGVTIPFWNDYSISDGENNIKPNENLSGLTGEDEIFIFINTIWGAGYNESIPFGADYLIMIRGSHMNIKEATFWSFFGAHGSDWKWAFHSQVSIGMDSDELEASISYAEIGVDPDSDSFAVYYSIIDWQNIEQDFSNTEGPIYGPTR
jgi:hypothetical protein